MAGITTEGLADLLNRLYEDYAKTEANREKRYTSGLSDLAQVTGLYGPGYGAGMEKAAIAGAQSSLIGRGLGGTTRMGAVSGGLKAEFEDLRRGKIAEALTRTADYKRTFPEGSATAGILSHLATGGFSAGLNAPAQVTGWELGPMASQGLNVFGEPMWGSSGISAPDFSVGGSGGGAATTSTSSGPIHGTSTKPVGSSYNQVAGQSNWMTHGSAGLPTGSTSQVGGTTATQTGNTPNIVNGYDTTGWTDAEKKAWAEYVPGVSGFNVPASKGQQKVAV